MNFIIFLLLFFWVLLWFPFAPFGCFEHFISVSLKKMLAPLPFFGINCENVGVWWDLFSRFGQVHISIFVYKNIIFGLFGENLILWGNCNKILVCLIRWRLRRVSCCQFFPNPPDCDEIVGKDLKMKKNAEKNKEDHFCCLNVYLEHLILPKNIK